MGWIGFGIRMGFRTMRYSRYAVRSVARTSRRHCHRRSNQPPPQAHRPNVALAAFGSGGLCALLVCTAIQLEHRGWRYYTDHKVLYQINDYTSAVQWCLIGAVAAFLGMLACFQIATQPKRRPAAPRGPQPPDGPVNPRMYHSNRR